MAATHLVDPFFGTEFGLEEAVGFEYIGFFVTFFIMVDPPYEQ